MTTTQNGFEAIELLKFETVQLRTPTITRATFYAGRPPLEWIKSRVAAIVEANPWLQGRLSRQEGKLTLRYPAAVGSVDRLVRVVGIPNLSFGMGFPELSAALKEHVVKRGALCVNRDEDLFRVTLANISDDRFALVASISHVIADGYTFYQVYKMLSETAPVRPLIADRIHYSKRDMEGAMRGGDDALPWMVSPGFVVNAAGSLLRRRKPTLNLFTVSQRKIDERKRDYEANNKPKFISTNDIIVSELFTKTACDIVFMTADVRDRIPGLTRDHAGNYERLIAYQREDFATPELIRSSIADYRRAVSGTLPGFLRSTQVKLGAITNLATIYQDVELPGCTLLFHRPVVDAAPFFPFEHTVYIFKSHQKQLSLLTCSKEPSVLSKVEILEDRIV